MKSLFNGFESLLFLCATAFAAVVFLTVPASGRLPKSKQRYVLDGDPKLGSSISALNLQVSDDSELTYLFYMGHCASCSLTDLDIRKIYTPAHARLIFVFSGVQSEEAVRAYRSKGDVRFDSDLRVAKLLNPLWTPRAYIVNHAGNLTWIANRPGEFPPEVVK